MGILHGANYFTCCLDITFSETSLKRTISQNLSLDYCETNSFFPHLIYVNPSKNAFVAGYSYQNRNISWPTLSIKLCCHYFYYCKVDYSMLLLLTQVLPLCRSYSSIDHSFEHTISLEWQAPWNKNKV